MIVGMGVAAQKLVIDTNIALDILVFNEPKVAQLKADLAAGCVQWLATVVMRDELERVLAYAQIAPRVAFYGLDAAAVLAAFDARVQLCPIAPSGWPPGSPRACCRKECSP